MLTRWNPDLPVSPYNLVLLLSHELDKMIGCKVKSKHRLINENNIDTNEYELPTTTTDVEKDKINNKYNEAIIDVRNGTKAHLSAEVIERINRRLEWAKELYHRGDYVHEMNSSHISTSGETNNSKKKTITLQLNHDITKGVFIGTIITTIILTTGFIIYRSSKNS